MVFSFSLSRSLGICESARVSAIHETERGGSPREGKRRVPFVRTRACLRACVSARLAVTYMRARAYDLFLAGVSQPPDALFGTTRCHAPVPPLPSLALTSFRLAVLGSRPPFLPTVCLYPFSISLFPSRSSRSMRFLFRFFDYPSTTSISCNCVKKLDVRFSTIEIEQKCTWITYC